MWLSREKGDKAEADSEPGSYLRIKCGMIPNPWSFSRLFLLISFALQAWARLNLIPGFNLDALEKVMSPARRWKNLEAPAGGNPWISCFPGVFKAGNSGFSQILRWQPWIFSWNSRFYLGISSPGILASEYSRNIGRAGGTPPGLQGEKQRKILEFAIPIPTFQIFSLFLWGSSSGGKS